MLYSGADLIRTSGQQAERLERLSEAAPVRPVPDTSKSGDKKSSLDEETQNTLVRLARFVKDERTKKERKPPKLLVASARLGLPPGYMKQIQLTDPEARERGQSLDIFV